MTIQPCGCGSNELDWPYDTDIPAEDNNGLHCGLDEASDTVMWVEPTGDVGSFVATKDTASGIGTGLVYKNLGSVTEQAGAAYFDGNDTFTAIREGMYVVTYKFQVSDSVVTALADDGSDNFFVYARVSSDYAAWGNPFLEDESVADGVGGSANNVSGLLPCLEGGTLTYEMLHLRGSDAEFVDIYMSAFWHSPIPA